MSVIDIRTFLKNAYILVKKSPTFLIDEISATHSSLLPSTNISTNFKTNTISTKTEQLVESPYMLKNQISMFASTEIV
ncbi:hypothetical protein QTI92_10990 [Clostridium perfringens]|uniref:hypothetical protein n=1 Tax=Clostridium perfringens TaxID=1502 RepID=UPI001CCC424D|nr:hypothetical protein [Clostridium perfringens]MDK0938281.1 hypothetical protein [Clostridium perfringens]MDM0961259.1 hypothetical protein [Clostridium perfringens]MDM0972708.1 hypothetical protein [Clostridium perfringens]MDU2435050.1 hypothetical protein [Clostridium perfringens]MDU2516082.1 hypothetical protein [Clostridium perfringens]